MDATSRSVPADVLRYICGKLSCPIDRLAMSRVCREFRAALKEQNQPSHLRAEPLPLPAQLPWLLLPQAEGLAFACLLSGGVLHRLDLPDDARLARYFGSHRGGWLFLAFRQTEGHALLNLRTDQRIAVPGATRIGRGQEVSPMVIHTATLSSSPLDEGCVAAAIVTGHGNGFHPARPKITFWRMGDDAVASGAFGTSWSLRLVDLAFHDGGFHCLTRDERILVCSPVFGADGFLDVGLELRLPQGRGYGEDQHVHGRYLIESRDELLMVVRFTPLPRRRQGTSSFRIFRLVQAQNPTEAGKIDYSWEELRALDGRMLFVGQRCSTSYEVGDFPGFHDGIYFLDDRRFYNHVLPGEDDSFCQELPVVPDGREYPCSDNGKWPGSSASPSGDVERCFRGPRQDLDQGEFTSPVWFLP